MAKVLIIVGALLAAVSLGGCAQWNEAHNHNSPTPATDTDIHAIWQRVQSPSGYATIVRTCVGRDGIYITNSGNDNIFVLPYDPACALTAVTP